MDSERIAEFDKLVTTAYSSDMASTSRGVENLRFSISSNPHLNYSENLPVIALHKYLVESDLAAAKQLFYLAGLSRLRLYAEFQSGGG